MDKRKESGEEDVDGDAAGEDVEEGAVELAARVLHGGSGKGRAGIEGSEEPVNRGNGNEDDDDFDI